MIKPRQKPELEWAFPLVLVGIIALFYWRVLFDGQIFVFVDASRFFYPVWKWGSAVLSQGFIPLWNPDAQFGAPYLADPQTAYAYPPVPLLYAFLSPVNAFAALVILHHLWALWGFWFFARGQGFEGRISFLGSVIFGFSLHLVCSSWTPVALMTISWIPWVFLAFEKVCRSEKNGFLFLSLAWAMQLAAGYPVLVYLTVLAAGLHLAWRMFLNPGNPVLREKGWKRRLRWDWIGTATGAGLIAVFYNLVWGLPFAELFRLSNYGNGASHYHDLTWLDFSTLLAPFLQGHPLLPGYHGPHYWVSTYFMGLPAVVLLLWGAIRLKYQKSSWGLLPLFLVLSLGVLGLGPFLRNTMGGYSLVIHSGYWLSLVVFWAAWMVMESSKDFLELKMSKNAFALWAFLALLVYGASRLMKDPWDPLLFWGSLALMIASSIVPLLGSNSRLDSWTRWTLLALGLGTSLGWAALSLNILLDRSYYQTPPASLGALEKEGRLFFTPPLLKEAVVLKGGNMEEAYEDAKERLYPNWPLTFGREEAPFYNTLQLKGSLDWTSQVFQYSVENSRRALDYLGIRYVFGKASFRDLRPVEHKEPDMPISENPSSLPKWFSVGKAVPAGASLEGDLAKAASMRLDYSKVCFLDGLLKEESYQTRRVEFAPQGPNRLEVEAQGPGKALVVSSETAYPGWRVWVDGQERAVETINHSFRGIQFNEGETKATFSFEPATFRLGLFSALVACGFWVLLFLKDLFLSRAGEE